MAEIKAFKGLVYDTEKAGRLDTLVCPPYDIISSEQREEYTALNPYNIVRLELPAGGDGRYKESGELLNRWLKDGILKTDDKDCLYVYEMEFKAYGELKKVKGFISLVKLEEFSKGIVLPHEETLSKAKTDRFNLMSETFCNFSQIYSLYMDENGKCYENISAGSAGNPDMEVNDGEVIHRI
ncbi:MAG: DUF1015 domain-containing protein, partial [Oscillospiraceae bacterium]|nr:DUF1015 domain-containing protein [Oscillospiraceae bacterium]